jgi:hypothetical protein
MELYSATRKDENLSFADKWMDKCSYPGSEGQKPHVLSHMWNVYLTEVQQYYETPVTLRGDHALEGYYWRGRETKNLKRCIYSLYKNEYSNLKWTENTIRKILR